jgi:hypothetical protein
LANIHKLGVHELAGNAANAVHFFSTLSDIRGFLRRPLIKSNNADIITSNDVKRERVLQ